MGEHPHEKVGLRITSDPDTTEITQPGTSAQRREPELPLRLLLVADLAPQSQPDWRGESLVRRVEPSTFSELMETWAPALQIEVPNRLSDEPTSLELSLRFASLKDFTPEGIAKQVPALARLLAIRAQIEAVRDRGLDRETFREALAEASVDAASADGLYDALSVEPSTSAPAKPAPSERGDPALESLLDMVDTGEPRASDRLSDALDRAVADNAPRIARSAADKLLADFDAKLAAQVGPIVAQPDVRRLEAAWRGLKLLVDRLPFRDGVQLEVLPAPREALSDALYHQVLVAEHSAEDDRAPLAAIILGFAFGHDQQDVALLDDLAGTAASLQAPLIASAGPAFFGFDGPDTIAALPLLSQLVEEPAYIHWNKLRDKDEARHLALAFPPFLLRAPYGPDHPARAFPLEEAGALWGGSALLAALALADAFARTGWPTHLTGGEVADLPLHDTERGKTPLATLLPEAKAVELAEAGFVVFTGEPNRDRVRLAHAPNLWKPVLYDDVEKTAQAAAHATLGCALFADRIAHRMLALPAELDPAASLEEKQREVIEALRRFLGAPASDVPEDAVTAEPVPDAEIEGHDLLAVRVHPPPYVLAHPVHIAAALPVPHA